MRAYIAVKPTERAAIAAGGRVGRALGARHGAVVKVFEASVEARAAFEVLRREVDHTFPRPTRRIVVDLDATYRRGVDTMGRAMTALRDSAKAAPSRRAQQWWTGT